MTSHSPVPVGPPRLYMAMMAGEMEFAVDLDRVCGVHGNYALTPCVDGPPHCAGTIVTRCDPIPVVDLRTKFRLGPAQMPRATAIVVVRTRGGPIGLLVERVSDIRPMTVTSVTWDAGPANTLKAGFIAALGYNDRHTTPLACVDRILSLAERRAFDHYAQRS